MTLTFLLKSLGACSEAVQWRGKRDLKTTWAECERGDWMLWLCGKMADKKGWPTRQQIVIAACDCAELSLPIFEKKYPNDKRPRIAIETARKWAIGKATIKEVRSAYAVGKATIKEVRSAYAADAAAYAAAYAADAAAYAAADAAADYAAARSARLRECADICRAKLKVQEMKAW